MNFARDAQGELVRVAMPKLEQNRVIDAISIADPTRSFSRCFAITNSDLLV